MRRDIDRTGQELASTLEALGERIGPKEVAERAEETVAEKVEDVRDQLSPVRAVRRGTERRARAWGGWWTGEGDDQPPSGPSTGQSHPLGRRFPGPRADSTGRARPRSAVRQPMTSQ